MQRVLGCTVFSKHAAFCAAAQGIQGPPGTPVAGHQAGANVHCQLPAALLAAITCDSHQPPRTLSLAAVAVVD
jgi:hypothetical protein